jgi:serine/threonine-protein kinase
VPQVTVPNIINRPEAEARELLVQALLEPVNSGVPRNDPAVQEGFVLEQVIAPGTQIAQGQPVTYTVSLGPELIEVPNLVQLNIEVARAEAQSLGLQVSVQEEPSINVTENFVISQNPLPQARVRTGETIFLTVSVGNKIRFPQVVGTLRPQAEQLLAINGLRLELVDEQGPDRLPSFYSYRPNEVVSASINGQPVQNGEFVPPGSSVVLGVRDPTP